MAELVEEGFYLAQCQQGRLVGCRLGEVHHHADMRTDVLALLVDELSLVFCHPCTSLLAFAWVEVGIEYSQVAAVLVEYLVGFDVWVVDGNVLVLLEGDAIELGGQSEDTLYHF